MSSAVHGRACEDETMNKLLKTAWLALAGAAILVSAELAAAHDEPERGPSGTTAKRR